MEAPSLELQLVESNNMARLSKEIAEKTQQLRNLRGEEIHGLNIEELQQLEKTLEVGLSRVIEKKGEKIMKEIDELERRVRYLNSYLSAGKQLMEENERLRQQVAGITSAQRQAAADDSDNVLCEEGQSSESVTNGNSGPPPPDSDSSDISLKLGLVMECINFMQLTICWLNGKLGEVLIYISTKGVTMVYYGAFGNWGHFS
ncbi:hypothetical protein Patl1_28319 [Pistacia atlantica]|uniref:Uncharacterized protein n=1 Tax=Pistacia atlantica TaxID=434234 RepID=A0ACC1BGV4_9ROSI|nr:hypothetical protein Patl1_28319 [Pistacia atlantica]